MSELREVYLTTSCNGIEWKFHHPRAEPGHLGYIPSWLSSDSPHKVAEQLDTAYLSGWNPSVGFSLIGGRFLKYPGDPYIDYFASAKIGKEEVRIYDHDWVMILQPSGAFEVCRMG